MGGYNTADAVVRDWRTEKDNEIIHG